MLTSFAGLQKILLYFSSVSLFFCTKLKKKSILTMAVGGIWLFKRKMYMIYKNLEAGLANLDNLT